MPPEELPEGVLGVNIAAGIAYLALVTRPDTPRLDVAKKLEPAANVNKWSQLKQFGERLLAEVRAHNCVAVAFAEPRKYNSWKYYDAFSRASLQVIAGLVLDAGGVPVHEVAQISAAKALGLKLGELDDKVADTLGIDDSVVTHWKQRIPALAVAMHVARGLWR